ncbi:MAG TPA: hypothetical protein VEC06_19870 [Paucimonas sp.]|nr:hypothetical protein [Paucimonas sp.]
MKRTAIMTLAAAALACLPLVGGAGNKPVNAFTESAAVASHAGQVRVTITFDNRGAHPVYVPNDLATEEELTNAFFEITTIDGEKIPYIGIMAKRAPPSAEDYRKIGPRSKHVNTIDITPSFDFKPGSHHYVLSYEARYLTDLKNLDKPSSAGMVRVEFTHAK